MALCQVVMMALNNESSSIVITYQLDATKLNLLISVGQPDEMQLNTLIKDYSQIIKGRRVEYTYIDENIPLIVVNKIKACCITFTQDDYAQIALSVRNLVSRNPLNAPNLNLRTSANLRKIKNYIYHSLKINLTNDELRHVLSRI